MVALILVFLLGVSPCQSEDPPIDAQPVCVWNAQIQGNGQGRSVLLLNDEVIRLD